MEQSLVNSLVNSDNSSNFEFFYQQQTAIQLLMAYQDEILDMFKHYQHSDEIRVKQNLKSRIYLNLAIYAQIEDEIFYPEMKRALLENGLVPELQMKFDPLIELICQIDFQNTNSAKHDLNIGDLEKYFVYYVKVQRDQLFGQAEKLGLNQASLGQKIHLRKMELLNG